MKIAFLNGSPKRKDSASGEILRDLATLLPKDTEYVKMDLNQQEKQKIPYSELQDCNSIVLAFPLYVDGVPSHLLRRLCEMEEYFRTIPEVAASITVYALVNCGFYEGSHNIYALQIIRNWCYRAGLRYGGGVGIGSGGMTLSVRNVPVGTGPKTTEGKVLGSLAEAIQHRTRIDDQYMEPNFPSILYKLAAQHGWRKLIKENGLTKKDLFRRRDE